MSLLKLLPGIALALLFTGWYLWPQEAKLRTAQGPIFFENAIQRSGIRFIMDNDASPQKHQVETMLSGVAVFDYNNDGLMDLYFVNGA